jgi:hypothetical protein
MHHEELIEGIDYTIDENGRVIYKTGNQQRLDYCCGIGLDCAGCPNRSKLCGSTADICGELQDLT